MNIHSNIKENLGLQTFILCSFKMIMYSNSSLMNSAKKKLSNIEIKKKSSKEKKETKTTRKNGKHRIIFQFLLHKILDNGLIIARQIRNSPDSVQNKSQNSDITIHQFVLSILGRI